MPSSRLPGTTPPPDSPLSPTPPAGPLPEAAQPRLTVPPLGVLTSPGPSTRSVTSPASVGAVSDPLEASGDTRSSEPESVPVKVDKRSIAEIVRGGVYLVSKFLADRLATTEEEQAAEVWIADTDDQAQIGDPIASIATRHGAPATAGNQDTADLIMAGIGLAGYLVKHAMKAWDVRRAARRLARLDPIIEHPQEEQ